MDLARRALTFKWPKFCASKVDNKHQAGNLKSSVMPDFSNIVDPVLFKGGDAAGYAVETLSNGGLGTRHLLTGKILPHVLAKDPAKILTEGLRVPNSPSPLMQVGQAGAGALQTGLQVANLGVGLLNLGVSAWTAWKVHKIDKKIDDMGGTLVEMGRKLDSVAVLLDASRVHLEGLIRGNTQMLGFLIEHQQHLGNGIELLRHELAQGVSTILNTLKNEAAKKEAQELEEQMRKLFRYYETCSQELRNGGQPGRKDLRRIVDLANELIAWLDTRLAAMEPGRADRLPLFVARAFALRLEIDARELLDESASIRDSEFAKLRVAIREELNSLTHNAPLMTLASERRAIIGEYVFLHRSLRGNATMVEFEDGRTLAMVPQNYLSWDDGLEDVRCLASAPSSQSTKRIPEVFELETLDEHQSWRRLKELPSGVQDDEIKTRELTALLGMSAEVACSERDLRKLLCKAPNSREAALSRIYAEVNE
jgi:hypothetical protein